MSKEAVLKIPSFSNKQKFMNDFLRNTEQYILELPKINHQTHEDVSTEKEVEKSVILLTERNGSSKLRLPQINKLKNLEKELLSRKKKLDDIDEMKKKRDLTKISREYVEYLEYIKKLQK